jgi:hypothetical protein
VLAWLQDPSPQDRLAALWNNTCVHAYFGDAEVAQISLRGAQAGTEGRGHRGALLFLLSHQAVLTWGKCFGPW